MPLNFIVVIEIPHPHGAPTDSAARCRPHASADRRARRPPRVRHPGV